MLTDGKENKLKKSKKRWTIVTYLDFQRNCNYKGNLHQWSNLVIKACSTWNFSTHMGKIPVREKKLIKSLWGFSLSLGCSHCSDKPFSHFLPAQSKQYLGNLQKKPSWTYCYGKEKLPKNLLIQECWRLHTDVTNTSTAISHCSKHFLSPLTKPHSTADFGEALGRRPSCLALATHSWTATR